MASILWAIITLLFIFWVVGLLMNLGGGLIHTLLVIAVVLVVYNLLTKGRASI